MAVYSSGFAKALVPGIYRHFEIGMGLRPSMRQMLFTTLQSENAWEEFVAVGGIDPTPFEQYKNQGTIGQLDFNSGYATRFTHEEYPVDLVLERKFVDDDKHGIVNTRAQRAAAAFDQLQEQQAADVFNNAFDATNYAGIDGQSLCDGAHPASPSDTGTTFSNSGTTALSADSIESTRLLMLGYTDDVGNKLAMMPDTLLVPPSLEAAAHVAVQSAQLPGSANNDANFQHQRWNIIPWQFLSDTNNWFMIDSVAMSMSLFWFNRATLGIDVSMIEGKMNQVQINYPMYARYSYGYSDWRWLYGHNVA
jgi:phage major head subunit gpT-like protein